MQPDPENNCPFPVYLYFPGPSILCRAEVSSAGAGEGGGRSEGTPGAVEAGVGG